MPRRQGVVKWPTARPALSALVDEFELPLPDAAVDRVLLVHALEMSNDPTALLREIWRVLASGGQIACGRAEPAGLWARMDTTPFGHGRPYSRSQITHLLREAWFTPVDWSEALYVPPIQRGWFLALGGGLGARWRHRLGAVRRRAYRRSDQAGLSRRFRPSARSGVWCRRWNRCWRRRPAAQQGRAIGKRARQMPGPS
jgi:SAM-dependent methyltransferase